MALTSGPNLGLLVNGSQSEVHYLELMRQWRGIDALVQCHVKSATVMTQPSVPSDGDLYRVPPGATGVSWSANINKLARYTAILNAWEYYTPKTGWSFRADDSTIEYIFNGTDWIAQSNPDVTNIITVTASRNMTSADANAYLRSTSAAAVTLTIGTTLASSAIGTEVEIFQAGAGQVTIEYPLGTINTAETRKTRAPGATIAIIKVGATEWDMTGDMEMVV